MFIVREIGTNITAFALRTLHAHGLSRRALWTVTQVHIISRLPYACSAWWSFCNSGERDQLAAVVTRLAKKNYLPPDQPTLHEMVATADVKLFNQVVANPAHVLAPLIPPSKSHSYNLRKRPHDLQIPSYKTNVLDKNFITRTILALNYTWTELCRLTLTSTIVNLLLYCFSFFFCPCVCHGIHKESLLLLLLLQPEIRKVMQKGVWPRFSRSCNRGRIFSLSPLNSLTPKTYPWEIFSKNIFKKPTPLGIWRWTFTLGIWGLMKLSKNDWIGTLIATVCASGDFIPQFPSSAKLLGCEQNCLLLTDRFSFLFRNVCLKCAPERLVSDYFISQKASASGGLRSLDPIPSFIIQQNLVIPSHQNITIFMIVGIWTILLVISNNCFKYAPKWMVSSLIFQNCSVEGFTEPPSPDQASTYAPLFFLGLCPGFVLPLNSRARQALGSGFALDSRALSTFDSGFALNFRFGILVFPK